MDDVLDALRAGLPLVCFLLLLQAWGVHRMRTAHCMHIACASLHAHHCMRACMRACR